MRIRSERLDRDGSDQDEIKREDGVGEEPVLGSAIDSHRRHPLPTVPEKTTVAYDKCYCPFSSSVNIELQKYLYIYIYIHTCVCLLGCLLLLPFPI